MNARAARLVSAVTIMLLLFGNAVSQAAPGDPGPPGGTPPGQIVSGRLSIVHGDDFEDHSSHDHGSVPGHVLPGMQYWLQTDTGEDLLLEFPGTPPEATPGGYYSARGERHGRAFHVAEMKEGAASKGGGGGSGKPGTTPASYVGPRDMIAILQAIKAAGALQAEIQVM